MTTLAGQDVSTAYTGNGIASGPPTGARLILLPFVAAASGVATSMFLWANNGAGDGAHVAMCLYDNSGNLLDSIPAVSTNTVGWVGGALSGGASIVSGQTYWLGFYIEPNLYASYGWQSNSTNRVDSSSLGGTYSAPASSIGAPSVNDTGTNFAIYIDGSTGGAGKQPAPPMNLGQQQCLMVQ